ncbi:MAG: type I glyceraldehyde-3-phosphate dehydrogenase [Rickettsiales bacterium]|jgi:glyceraldehyde 3-phosphate dehydrogenase|nr:type I glyceraldehyde-3-phosphate dehydrogenase [Rickettsiales bacterium]
MVKVAINGFGRIGRLTFRALVESGRNDIEVAAINDLGDISTQAHLLRYDSVHGRLDSEVKVEGDRLVVGGQRPKYIAVKDPASLPWRDFGIDIVFECTGIFTDKEKAIVHLTAGAKRVLVSAPSKGADLTVVYGVNHTKLTHEHLVVSNASCTTNCLAPVASVLNDAFGIAHGFMTTIHSYTGDQVPLDRDLKGNLYRSRAAACNIIPTSTGAAKAIGEVIPELKGRLDGVATRVPTPDVSLVDFKFVAKKNVSAEEVNDAITEASKSPRFKGILGVNDEALVSSDFIHNSFSSTFDLNETKVIEGNFVRVMSWYDNEWGFSNRMLDTAAAIAATIK